MDRRIIIGVVVVIAVILILVVTISLQNTKSKPLLKTIVISTAMSPNYLNIGELKVFDANGVNILTAAAVDTENSKLSSFFKKIEYYPISNLWDNNVQTFAHSDGGKESAIQTATVVFTSPVQASSIVMFNRIDCCQDRIAGGTLNAFDSAGNNIGQLSLTAEHEQTLVL